MMAGKILLAGDVGGTKTLLQLAESGAGGLRVLHERRFDSCRYPGLVEVLADFFHAAPLAPHQLHSACFGVAGPLDGQRAALTNLPWQIDARAIGDHFGIERLRLLNDFEAVGYGIELLAPGDLVTLQQGRPQPHAPRAVIGAGTGLGEGLLVWQGDHYQVIASEGGHVDFAPTDEEQFGLWKHLARQYGHVSCERILSGPGLAQIYAFLRDSGAAPESPELAAAIRAGDPAAAIAGCALRGEDSLAAGALDMFVNIYGAQAGNLALTLLATGGVYVAGGIAPKIVGKLREGGFLRAFAAKGRYAALLSEIPVHVVIHPAAGLLGAAAVASRL